MNNRLPRVGLAIAIASCALLAGCGNAQTRKAKYVQHGQEYFAAGNFDKARVEYRNAAQIDPKDPLIRYYLGQVAEKTGDAREAVGEYRAAISGDPKLVAPRAALGRLYIYGGLPDKAMELAEAGLTSSPGNAQLLIVRAAGRQRLGDPAGALADAEAAARLAPDDDYGVALLASLYEQGSQLDRAIQVVQAAVQRRPQALDLRVILADLLLHKQEPRLAEDQLTRIVALDPRGLANRYRLAKFYLVQKDVDAAECTLRAAVAAVPDSADAKVQLVEFLLAQRGREPAIDEVTQLISRDSANDVLQLSLGQFLLQVNANERAEALFRAVIEHAGKQPAGLTARDRLAALLLARGDARGAGAQVAATLKENARDNDALIVRSQISLAGGDAPAAIADLRAVLRDQPNAVTVMRALAQAYVQNNQPDLAADTIRAAVQTEPGDTASRFELAQLLTSEGKFDQAEPLLKQLAKDDPLNVQVQATLFRAQAAQKHVDDARATAAAIQKTRPDLSIGQYLMGMVEEQQQRYEQAERDYDAALKLQPNATEPLTAVTRLDAQRRQPQRALARLDAIIASQSGNGLARSLKAELLASQGQLEGAIAAFEDAIRAAPKWANSYHGLALVQVAAKHDDDAVRTLQLGIAKADGASTLISDLAALYQRQGRADQAVALYENQLAKDPNSAFAANNLAMLLVTVRTDPASLARAQKLADQLAASSVVGVIDTRGWVKYNSGDLRGAEALLQQAVDKAPDAPELRYHLGMVQLRSGAARNGIRNLESAVSSPQPFPGIDEARAALLQARKSASAG